jgi:Uma2 family endonuclease
MSQKKPTSFMDIDYEKAAQEYLRSLPPEHFMEAIPQATQREITLESLALVRARRSDVHVFNELLVQYHLPDQPRPGQVVPDNMVVVYEGVLEAEGSYDIPFQPAGPFWVLEYVSRSSRRKDYETNMEKYEQHLLIPYYLLFAPEEQEMSLFRHNGTRYVTVYPDEHGRCSLPELELEVAILDHWVRFWFRGELLPLPGELLEQRDQAQQEREQERRRANQAQQERERERLRAEQAQQERERERLRAEQAQQERERERLRAEQAQQERERERLRAEQAQQERERERLRAEQAQQEREREKRRVDQAQQEREQEKRRAEAAEAEMLRLRAELERLQSQRSDQE